MWSLSNFSRNFSRMLSVWKVITQSSSLSSLLSSTTPSTWEQLWFKQIIFRFFYSPSWGCWTWSSLPWPRYTADELKLRTGQRSFISRSSWGKVWTFQDLRGRIFKPFTEADKMSSSLETSQDFPDNSAIFSWWSCTQLCRLNRRKTRTCKTSINLRSSYIYLATVLSFGGEERYFDYWQSIRTKYTSITCQGGQQTQRKTFSPQTLLGWSEPF